MSIRRVVPDITCNQIHESRKFYTGFFGLRRGYGHGLGCHARLALQSNGSDHARAKDRIDRATTEHDH
jgi:hypothetical protein